MDLLSSLRPLLRPREEVYAEASENRQFNVLYLMMLVLSCLISLLGLLLNSPAVIIGAMLISPLMGPILACGLALTLADSRLGRKAALNVALSVVEAIAIAAAATFLSPLKVPTPEILARTQPNLMDLLVAFFAGLAGTLAAVSGRPGFTILPGVAIATAVMPPLATTGYGLSTGQMDVARGSFMLFFTNLTAIVVSADLAYLMAGFRPHQSLAKGEQRARVWRRVVVAAVILAVLSVPLMRTLTRAAQQARMRRDTRVALSTLVGDSDERRLEGVDLRLAGADPVIAASIRTAAFIERPEIEKWRQALAIRLGHPVRLEVQQIQLAHAEPVDAPARGDFLAPGVVQASDPPPPRRPYELLRDVQEEIQGSLGPLVQGNTATAPTVDSVGADPDGTLRVVASCRVARAGDEAMWRVAATALAREMKCPVRLRVRAVHDTGTVLRFEKGSDRLPAPELRRLREISNAGERAPGARLVFTLSGSEDAGMAERRLARLRTLAPTMDAPLPLDGPDQTDTARVYEVDELDIRSSIPVGPSPSPSPPPSPPAPASDSGR